MGMKRKERGDFPEKKFLGTKNKKLCGESVAPRAPRPRGPPPPYNGVFAMFAAM